jgi:hypothetical protein
MKTLSVLMMIPAFLSAPVARAQSSPANQPGERSCAVDVVEALGDQGEWSTLPNYGPAWHPRADVVGANFEPYVTGGTWVLRDGRPYFHSRWPWGDRVFSSGNWTFTAKSGWLWIPDGRCLLPYEAQSLEDDMLNLPPLRNPIKVRTIKHPIGITFAYPYGQEWGRVLPAGVAATVPRWLAQVPAKPGTPVNTNLLPNWGQQ